MGKTARTLQPVLLDAEPGSNGLTTWRAGGPGTEKLNGRVLFGSAGTAVAAIRDKLPERRMILCPATPADRKEAAEAAAATPEAMLGPYAVWIEERRGHAGAWAIHWPRTTRKRPAATRTATLAVARERIRNRRTGAPLRIVALTDKGRAEAAALPEDANTLVREYLPAHVI